MEQTVENQVEVLFNAAGDYYIAGVGRNHTFWLSVGKFPLPVADKWQLPGAYAACIMRGRDYYRLAFNPWTLPQTAGQGKFLLADDELARDYRDACWWSAALEEAWRSLDKVPAITAVLNALLEQKDRRIAELETMLYDRPAEAKPEAPRTEPARTSARAPRKEQ